MAGIEQVHNGLTRCRASCSLSSLALGSAAPPQQLLGASCQAEPFLCRISLLKDTLVTWGAQLGDTAALALLRGQELRHRMGTGTGQMALSCHRSTLQPAPGHCRTRSSAHPQHEGHPHLLSWQPGPRDQTPPRHAEPPDPRAH